MTNTASRVIQVVRIPVFEGVKNIDTGVAGSTPVMGSEREVIGPMDEYCDGWCIDCDGGCKTEGTLG